MIEKLKIFLTVHKLNFILIGVLLILLLGGFFVYQRLSTKEIPLEEVALIFDAEGPYALLFPRRDGNALILNLKRTASYDSITYELAYTSQAEEAAETGGKVIEQSKSLAGVVDRGVAGTIDTKQRRGEYEQEILFGTCSRNVCKYDKRVENGTLTLHIRKGNKAFKMITQWHLQGVDVALGKLSSGDGHFVYEVDAERVALANVGFSIINDLTGVPKLPSGKEVLGKVYALNMPIAKSLQAGDVTLELAENPPADTKLYRHDGSKWEELDTKIDGSKLSAKAGGAGIFAVLIPKK